MQHSRNAGLNCGPGSCGWGRDERDAGVGPFRRWCIEGSCRGASFRARRSCRTRRSLVLCRKGMRAVTIKGRPLTVLPPRFLNKCSALLRPFSKTFIAPEAGPDSVGRFSGGTNGDGGFAGSCSLTRLGAVTFRAPWSRSDSSSSAGSLEALRLCFLESGCSPPRDCPVSILSNDARSFTQGAVGAHLPRSFDATALLCQRPSVSCWTQRCLQTVVPL